MLFGCKELHVHMDHKNLTYANLNSQRVIHWCLFVEECHPIFHYIKGDCNTFAATLSCLPPKGGTSIAVDDLSSTHLTPTTWSWHASEVGDDQLNDNDAFTFSTIVNEEEVECFLNIPLVDAEHPFALNYSTIANAQKNNLLLVFKLRTNHAQYGEADIGNKQTMIVFHKRLDNQARICLPDALLETTVSFYHQVLGHASSSRVIETIARHFYNPKIASMAKDLIDSCEACQLYKA